MAMRTRVRRRYQVTIPQEVRDRYPIMEGQYVRFEVTPKGILVTLSPEMDPDQAWFWSPRWAEMERKADEDFRAGRVVESASAEEALEKLKGGKRRR